MKKCLTYLLVFGMMSFGWAQEGQFSQYFSTGTVLNPAFTGTVPSLSFNSNYKRGGSPSTDSFLELMQVTFTYPLKRTTSREYQIGGVGLTFFQEKRGFQGIYNARKILLTGAYAFRLSRLHNRNVIFGLQGGLAEHRIDGTRLTWGSQYNRYIGFDDTLAGEAVGANPIYYPTFNFGVVYTAYDNENRYIRDKSLVMGVSVDNLNRPLVSVDGLEGARKAFLFKAFASSKFPISPRWYIHPSGLVLYSQGVSQINTGMYLSTYVSSPRANRAVQLQVGTWYRLQDSIIVLTGFEIENLRVGFSLDLNTQSFDISEAQGAQLPTYEVSLTYNLDISKGLRNTSSPIF